MPSAGTTNRYTDGYWVGTMGSGGSATSRVTLSEPCAKPEIAYHQHSGSDSSLNGMYFILRRRGRKSCPDKLLTQICAIKYGCLSSETAGVPMVSSTW